MNNTTKPLEKEHVNEHVNNKNDKNVFVSHSVTDINDINIFLNHFVNDFVNVFINVFINHSVNDKYLQPLLRLKFK